MMDIGSCDGLNAIDYLKIFPDSIIYAFEPVPENYESIEKNKQRLGYKNLIPIKLALSNKKGITSFHLSSSDQSETEKDNRLRELGTRSSSLLAPKKTLDVHKWLKFDDVIEIPTERLDNFCKSKSINGIDFIHMDVQGAELLVLEGAGERI